MSLNVSKVAWLILFIFILLFSCYVTVVNAVEYKKESLHAAFIFNFARFTDWPEEFLLDEPEKIRICIAGNILNEKTTSQLSNKIINKKNIAVHHLLDVEEANRCHLLFINSLKLDYVEKVLKKTREKPILTVGISQDFLRLGGVIKLFDKDERIRFTVNIAELKKSHLKISSRILKLATIEK